jgi:integrase
VGALRLQNLRPLHLVHLYGDRQRQPGVSVRRVQMVARVLNSALRDAVRWHLLPSNPATDLTPACATSPERPVWTEDEAARFLKLVQRRRRHYDNLWVFLLGSACRVGEALALMFKDVDWDRGVVSISHAIGIVKNRPVQGPPKTQAGYRQITLPPFALDALKAQRQSQHDDDARCFQTRASTVPTYTRLRVAFKAACRAAAVPEVTIHTLRHIHASLAIRNGVDPKTLQRRLGHSSLSMTLGLYAHALPSGDEQAAQALESALNSE